MKRDFFLIGLLFVLASFVFYLYIYLQHGELMSVYKAWDGPSYVLAAISLYQPQIASDNNFINSVAITPEFTFLPAHFPLYPLLIRAFSFLGYFRASVLISLLFSLFCYFAFYQLLQDLKIKQALWVVLPFIFIPPRWFIVSHTGSSEPIFIFFLLMSLRYFLNHRFVSSASLAALAQLVRPQGALLGLGFLLVAIYQLIKTRDLKKIISTYYPYLLIPVALVLVFTFYYFQTGNFWAFFDAISIFHHFRLELFPVFKWPGENVETFWQEVNVFNYVFYLAAILSLLKNVKLRAFGLIAIPFFLPLIFLQHSDISRYGLPLVPFAYLALAPYLLSPVFTLATLLTSPAVFRYAATFISLNRAI